MGDLEGVSGPLSVSNIKVGRPCHSQRDQCMIKLPIFRSAQREQHHTREALPQSAVGGSLRRPCPSQHHTREALPQSASH